MITMCTCVAIMDEALRAADWNFRSLHYHRQVVCTINDGIFRCSTAITMDRAASDESPLLRQVHLLQGLGLTEILYVITRWA